MYKKYVAEVPKHARKKDMPRTPNKYIKFSRRSWDKQVFLQKSCFLFCTVHFFDMVRGETYHHMSEKMSVWFLRLAFVHTFGHFIRRPDTQVSWVS